jgi:2'-5' RNA ligase
MRETTRTFIAIPIPEPIGKQLLRLQAELTPQIPGCRWTASTFHVTLAFLGDVRNSDLNDLCQAVASAATPLVPFELRLEGLGAFPSPRKPSVLWAGVTASDPISLRDLREAVVGAATQVGYRTGDPRFHPHVTLGRFKSYGGRDLTAVLERGNDWSGGSFSIVEVITFASTLDSKGPTYAPLGRARLAGKKTTDRA